ncbi:MAG: ETC complex I subunit [Rhodospirillales bacterium]
MSEARIYKPCKSAMQSGRAHAAAIGGEWVLDFTPTRKHRDRLMGWASSNDMSGQVQLRFPGKDAAVAYAREKGLSFTVHDSQTRKTPPKNYAANFAPRRVV